MTLSIFSFLLAFFIGASTPNLQPNPQDLSAEEIIQKSEENFRGATNIAEVKMTINRPKWTREMVMKSWSIEDRLVMIVVKEPARDKGTAFLKRDREIWNWVPSIEKVVKLPPSMMMQSWMGSDFTNDDLVKQSSIVLDYVHEISGEATLEDRVCWELTLTPKEDAPVVWGKVKIWIDQKDFLQLKTEFYDEDDYLVNTMYGKEVGELGGRTLPKVLEIIPADEEGHKTRIEYLAMDFSKSIKDSFFSVQQMKRVR